MRSCEMNKTREIVCDGLNGCKKGSDKCEDEDVRRCQMLACTFMPGQKSFSRMHILASISMIDQDARPNC